jgi:hypothetical protein
MVCGRGLAHGQLYLREPACWRYFGSARMANKRAFSPAGSASIARVAAQPVPVIDRRSGESRQAQVFVAVLGGLQLHLRQSHLVAAGARLAGLPYLVLRLPRRNTRDRGAGAGA